MNRAEIDSRAREVMPSLTAIVKEAGDALRGKRSAKPLVYKEDGSFATQADLESEQFLKRKLAPLIEHASFIAEESGEVADNSPWCWVIDPLDGTHNFSRGLPYFAVTVALTAYDEPVAAVTYAPVFNELFSAVRGQGSYLNDQRLEVSKVDTFSDGFIVLDVHTERFLSAAKQTRLVEQCYSVRQFGACAIDLAYVAAGRFDGGLYKTPQWWDVAAGSLFIHEAGGSITDRVGNQLRPGFDCCVASNGRLHNSLRAFLI